MTLNLFHNNLRYPNIRSRVGGSGGLGLVVVVRLMDVVWQERVVCFVRNVRGCQSFNVKGYCMVVVVFVSELLNVDVVGVFCLGQMKLWRFV